MRTAGLAALGTQLPKLGRKLKGIPGVKGGKTAGLAKRVPPEQLGMAGAIGGAVIPQIRNALNNLPKTPAIQGGKAGFRSAGR